MGISCAYIEDASRRPSGRAMFERLAARRAPARFHVFQGTRDWNTPVAPVRALEAWNASTGHLRIAFHYYDGGHTGTDDGAGRSSAIAGVHRHVTRGMRRRRPCWLTITRQRHSVLTQVEESTGLHVDRAELGRVESDLNEGSANLLLLRYARVVGWQRPEVGDDLLSTVPDGLFSPGTLALIAGSSVQTEWRKQCKRRVPGGQEAHEPRTPTRHSDEGTIRFARASLRRESRADHSGNPETPPTAALTAVLSATMIQPLHAEHRNAFDLRNSILRAGTWSASRTVGSCFERFRQRFWSSWTTSFVRRGDIETTAPAPPWMHCYVAAGVFNGAGIRLP